MPPRAKPKAKATTPALPSKQLIRDPAEQAASRAFVVQRTAGNHLERDNAALIIDVFLFNAIVLDRDKITAETKTGNIRLAFKDSIKRQKVFSPRSWDMMDDSLGAFVVQASKKGLPLTVRVAGPKALVIDIGPQDWPQDWPQENLAVADSTWLSREVVPFFASYLLNNERVKTAPVEYTFTEADFAELYAAHPLNKQNQTKAGKLLLPAEALPVRLRLDTGKARLYALAVAEAKLFDHGLVTKGEKKFNATWEASKG